MCNRIILRLVAFGGLAAFSHFVSAADLTGQVTLAQALALTLKQNPDLAAFSWDVRSAEARILQARLWPNPELGTQSEDIGFSLSHPLLRAQNLDECLCGLLQNIKPLRFIIQPCKLVFKRRFALARSDVWTRACKVGL